MLLPTLEFLLFFALVFVIAAILKKYTRIYKYFLLLISGLFYLSWGAHPLLLLSIDIVANYGFVRMIHTGRRKRLWLVLGILFNAGFWGYLKYYNFFADSLFELLHNLGLAADLQLINVVAPLGISFYTFRIVSHLVDSYKDELAMPSLLDFANYVSFFPQIASGPIAVAGNFYKNLNGEKFKYDQSRVMLLLASGLFKKYVLASFLFSYVNDPFTLPTNYSGMDLALAALAYSFMLYVDFSGYTDLSTAIANLLGFSVPTNFNMPYQALSLKQFWRRWHMTLGRWLKYYIYIPLGGNRKGTIRKYINLIITMTFAGFWHGAGTGYIVWGLMHGVGLVADQLTHKTYSTVTSVLPQMIQTVLRLPMTVIAWAITLGFVSFTRIYFNARDMATAGEFVQGMIEPYTIIDQYIYDIRFMVVMVIILGMNFVEIPILNKSVNFLNRRSLSFRIIIAIVLFYVILSLGPDQVAPFIYFKF